MKYFVFGLLALCASLCASEPGDLVAVVVQLNQNWTLSNQNQTIKRADLNIPTGVYSTLTGDDVLQSYNDMDLRWISYDNWTYAINFTVNLDDLTKATHVNLTFHGIDTVAEIRLNSHVLGHTDNMFVRYSFIVTDYLQAENLLEVEIKSPIYAALERANALAAAKQSVPPKCPPKRYNGECHMNMLRKMQASFSWDWGLAAPSVGIWKSVALEYYEVAVIRDIDVVTSRDKNGWNLDVRVYMDTAAGQDFYGNLSFTSELLQNQTIDYELITEKIDHKNPVLKFRRTFSNDTVEPWWPNGYGQQKLYAFNFTLNAWLNTTSPKSRTISSKSIKIGFRTIELVEDRIAYGNSFLFKVNDVEIFMKGTNYIPAHILPERGSDQETIKYLLQAARDTHSNMMRVWGGGVYESDYFYDLADEYGILIWQDMMFACAMYPVTKDFLDSVRTEVRQNALRLSHHASVAIFATNNENEVALAQGWYRPTLLDQKRFKAEYRELYLNTVMDELNVIADKSRPTPLVSSPSNGKESAKDNYLSKQPQDPNYGDVHFYDYIRDGWNQNTYPRPRFSSEYGVQSLPQMSSWQRILGPKDNLLDMIDHRQHHTAGDLPIVSQVRRHLPLPSTKSANYSEALIYFSQISQAMSTKVETELYRSLRDTEHRTMGALYWQLNDVWVAPSWSSIDFYGNYKLLHHWAKDFMAPISIIAIPDSKTQTLNLSITCDHLSVPNHKYEVTQNIYAWSEFKPKNSTTWAVKLKPNGVFYDKFIPLNNILSGNFTEKNSFVEFTLKEDNKTISRNFYFPGAIKSAEGLTDPEITLNITANACRNIADYQLNSFNLTLTAKRPAAFVYVEFIHPDIMQYKLSQNGFMQTTAVEHVQLEFKHKNCLNINKNHLKILTVNQFMKEAEDIVDQ